MSYDIYARISKEGDRTHDEVEEQLDVYENACRVWAAREGIEIGEVERESNVSGAKAVAERKLDRLILRVEAGESEGILAPDLDRFGRDVIEGSLALKRVVDAGGRFVGVNDGTDTAQKGSKLIIGIRLQVAEDYLERTKDRFQERINRAVERGLWLYPVPYGYRMEQARDASGKLVRTKKGQPKGNGILLKDKDAAKLVVEMFRRRANGDRVGDIYSWALGQGFTGTKDRVRSILGNRCYLGEMSVQDKRKGQPRVVKNHHVALFTEPQWLAAQVDPEAYAPRDGSIAAGCKLAKLVYCATCGERCRTAKGGRKGAVSYTCVRDGCDAHAGMSAAMLDPLIVDVLEDAIMHRHPAVGRIIEGSTVYADGLAEYEQAVRVHDEYRDDLDAQAALGMPSWLAGLKVRKEAVENARKALSEARKATAPDWFKGKTGKVSLEAFLAEDERWRFERFIDRVVIRPSGRGTGRILPVAERVDVFFIGDTEPYVGVVGAEKAA